MGIITNPLEMAQVSVTISDETEKLLEEMAQATGLTKSSLASEILRQGLYREAANLVTVANFREKLTPVTSSAGKRRSKAGNKSD
jgi:predicted DNA-binding protein